MNEEQRRILKMVAEGKITSEEAESLLDSLAGGRASGTASSATSAAKEAPKFLRVMVHDETSEHGGKVNIRVPMNLIRAGVKLAALLPKGVNDQVNKALAENGIDFDVSKVKPENLEELVQHLAELTIDVEGNKGERVRIFCE